MPKMVDGLKERNDKTQDLPITNSPHRPVSGSIRSRLPTSYARLLLGLLLIMAGLGAALVTVLARRTNEPQLAGAAAILSLVIAVLIVIFIIPPLARSARLEVIRLDFPIELTTGGAIFLLIIGLVGFAAWNTGNNLLFLVFSLLCSAAFVSWAAARVSLRDLVVSARFPDHIFAGEPAPVIVTVRNTKRLLPSFSVLVEARGPLESANNNGKKQRQQHQKRTLAYFAYVPHRAAAEQRVEQLFSKRGHVLINGFELSTRFPFGFVRRRRRLKARDVDIIVYPKPEAISDQLHLLPTYAGQMASLRRGAGHDLFSLRDYQAQDDLRHIDWKATARSRRLTVKEFTSEDERRITIELDLRRPVAEPVDFEGRFERGVVQTASLLKHFIDERAEVRLVLGNEIGPYGSGLDHLYRCLKRLAPVKPQSESGFEGSRKQKSASRSSMADHDFAILLTTALPGSIPARVWRMSHVIYL